MMKKMTAAIFFLLLILTSNSFAIELDLKMCIEAGIKNNPKVQSATYTELSKSEDVKSALLNLVLPDITITRSRQDLMSVGSSGSVDVEYLDQIADLTSFNISKDIISLISDLPLYHRAGLEKKIAEYQKRQTILQLVRDISVTFYSILKVEQDIKSLRDAISHLKVNYEYAKALFEKRFIPYTDVLNTKVDLEDAKQRLSIEKNKRLQYLSLLKTLIGIPPEEELKPKYNVPKRYSFNKSFEECLKIAFKNRPELQILEFRKRVYEDEKKVWLCRILPSLDVGISFNDYSRDYKEPGRSLFGYYNRDFEISYWNAYVSMRWEFTSLPKNLVHIRRVNYDIKAVEKQIEDTRNSIEDEVRRYYLATKEALQRITTTKIALKAAEENYRRAAERFRLLLGSISEVLDAQARLTRARANYSQAILDFQASLANLKYAMGIGEGV